MSDAKPMTYTLTSAVRAHDADLKELAFREPTTADILAAGLPATLNLGADPPTLEINERKMAGMMARLASVPPSTIQQLAPVVVPAVYKPAHPDRVAPEPILFFPEMPAQKRAPAVVAPPNRLRSNEAFSLRHRRGRLDLRASRVIEKTPSIELIEVFASQTV